MKYKSKLLIGAIPIALLAGGLYYSNIDNKQNHPIVESRKVSAIDIARQQHLDNLLKKDNIPYCAGVVYDYDGSQIINYVRSEVSLLETPENVENIMKGYEKQYIGGDYDAKTPEILELSAQDRTSKIFIGREIFEKYSALMDEDLRHLIIAHEGRHVEQHALGLEYLPKQDLISGINNNFIRIPVLYEVGEYDANGHALCRIISGEFKVSDNYFKQTKSKYVINNLKLTAAIKSSSTLERELILNVQAKMNSFPELKAIPNP